jgi:hypothetical protein
MQIILNLLWFELNIFQKFGENDFLVHGEFLFEIFSTIFLSLASSMIHSVILALVLSYPHLQDSKLVVAESLLAVELAEHAKHCRVLRLGRVVGARQPVVTFFEQVGDVYRRVLSVMGKQ